MDIETLLVQGRELIDQTTKAHAARWGLGTAQRWVLDQDAGRITWAFEDRVVSAPAQILGSWNSTVDTFVWSWDNDTIHAPLRASAEQVRAFGIENEVAALNASPLNLNEEQVRDLIALAFGIVRGTGLYHPFDGQLATYICFGEVTIEEPGGRTSTFDGSTP
jgi:hypothetical protein